MQQGMVVEQPGAETLIKQRRTAAENGIATMDNTKGPKNVVDVVANNKYKWTLSNVTEKKNNIPRVYLYEHRNTEPAMKRMMAFYAYGIMNTTSQFASDTIRDIPLIGGVAADVYDAVVGGAGHLAGKAAEAVGAKAATTGGSLDVYREIFPDSPTNNTYIFPFFSQTFMELRSPNWTAADSIADSIGGLAQSSGDLIGQAGELMGGGKAGRYARMAGKGIELAGKALPGVASLAESALGWQYPVVGVFDRPRMFSGHSERSLTIEFPLYNTIGENDWKSNRDLVYSLMTQFLYIKQSYITGIPPVFYRVHVPNQYYSFASCVTDFSVKNLGNIHDLYGYFVPDAFQVSIVLTEMCMPSLNQFQALSNGEALGHVEAGVSGS